jgi:hypothetical protein
MAVETESLLTNQERGTDLHYHIIAVNKSGEGEPSNIVRVLL